MSIEVKTVPDHKIIEANIGISYKGYDVSIYIPIETIDAMEYHPSEMRILKNGVFITKEIFGVDTIIPTLTTISQVYKALKKLTD